MEPWLTDLLTIFPDTGNYTQRRRMMILYRWPDASVRAAEQDARNGDMTARKKYDEDVAKIKAATPKMETSATYDELLAEERAAYCMANAGIISAADKVSEAIAGIESMAINIQDASTRSVIVGMLTILRGVTGNG